MNRHLNRDEVIDQLYGIGSEATSAHMASCLACQEELGMYQARRAGVAIPMEVSADILAAQRRRILARVEHPSASPLKWIPALAAACLILVFALAYRPSAPVPVTKASNVAPYAAHQEMDQLYSDIYELENAEEPRAASPIRGLFEPIAFAEGNQ